MINSVQYVAIVNQAKEDLQYDKQSKEDKAPTTPAKHEKRA